MNATVLLQTREQKWSVWSIRLMYSGDAWIGTNSFKFRSLFLKKHWNTSILIFDSDFSGSKFMYTGCPKIKWQQLTLFFHLYLFNVCFMLRRNLQLNISITTTVSGEKLKKIALKSIVSLFSFFSILVFVIVDLSPLVRWKL